MANKLSTGEFSCSICGTKYPSSAKADTCRDSHEILYIPMTKTELNRLLHAINLRDIDYVPQSLLETLGRYQRANFKD